MKNIVLLLTLVAPLLFVGCQTSGKFLATTVTTVDAAMKGWAEYVVIGGATEQQQMSVKAAYEKYQVAEQAAEAAYVAAAKYGDDQAWLAASAALQESRTALFTLIASFNPQQRTLK